MKSSLGLACAMLSASLVLPAVTPAFGETVLAQPISLAVTAKAVEGVNAAIRNAGARWAAADNPIMRLTPAQRKRRLGLKQRALGVSGSVMSLAVGATASLPASLDWRNYNGKNYVTPVKDQGDCGSCWVFATTGGLESYVLRTQGQSLDISEQIVLSCSNAGSCDWGGDPSGAAAFMQATGVGPESAYPYTQTDGNCSKAAAGWQKGAERIGKWTSVTGATATADALKHALFAYGPLPTTLQVYDDFFAYVYGVYSYTGGPLAGGHAVLLVGYDDVNQCFIVKNSWGPDWGENGYFRIAYSQMANSINFGAYTIAYASAAPAGLSVAIASPANNASVSGAINVGGTASETASSVLVSQVQVQVDNGGFLPATGTTKWSYSLNTNLLGNGKHTVTARAINTIGAAASAAVTINVAGDPPAITSPASATVAVGAAFKYAITAASSPTGFSAAGLPAGLSVNTQTGVISGAVTKAGTYGFTVSATNSKGSGSRAVNLYVGAPTITSPASTSGVMGTPFRYAITATNGPTSFTAAGVPAGLNFDVQAGVISGYPTKAGAFNVSLGAANAVGQGTLNLSVAIALPPAPAITSAASATGKVGTGFSYQIKATNNPTGFNAAGLPSWASFDQYRGSISGMPTSAGSSKITLSAANPGGNGTATLALTIAALPAPVITSPASATGAVGQSFNGYAVTATNNPTSYGVTGLPPGLNYSASAQDIWGIPTQAGVFKVTLSASNMGGTGTLPLAVTITLPPPPVIKSAGSAAGKVGTAFYYAIFATNAAGNYSAAGVPPGLSFDSILGVISGKPTKAGTYSVSLIAANAGGTGTKTLVITIKK